MEALEPVRWGEGTLRDVQFELTDEGKTNPMFAYGSQQGEAVIRELPGMTSVTRVSGPKSLAHPYLGVRIGAWKVVQQLHASQVSFDPWAPLPERMSMIDALKVEQETTD